MADPINDLFECFNESATEKCDTEATTSTEIRETTDSISEVKTKSAKRKNDEDIQIASKRKKSDEGTDVEFAEFNIEEFKNRISVQIIESVESCTHEVAYPSDQDYIPLQSAQGKPAKTYPFVLDPFQKESILCVENNQSVLVSAHTSAGKTVIAEYAIALSLKNKQRVIYTTPIKALSNQKYREFLEEFKDVGLMTGDVTIDPTASCLVMTTEILRNMLYKGSEIMREVGWVIFDEIHYMRDKERGVVWEETLILLPHNVHFVFLSATIPNARQFAEWVTHLHQQPCHVVYTDYRPTPLQHFIYPAGGTGMHMVVDETGTFKEDNFNAAMAVLQNSGAAKGDRKGRGGGISNKDPAQTDILKLVKMIMEKNFAPVIIFSFSKKNCELYAMQMTKLDFNTTAEKKLVDEVFNNAMNILSDEDRNLPQIEHILPLLRRGIGIHHGGLLPILKETIEILFGEGLIKALFATETFAMGLNMPARTVLFTGMKKFDGTGHRWITSGEYIQMSGRAGRRGLDDKGIVILMVDEKVPPAAGRNIVKGLPDVMNSAFHLTYGMVLNLLRVEEINPEYMLERSFYQFQKQTAVTNLCEKFKQKFEESNEFEIESEEDIASYYELKHELNALRSQLQSYITKPNYLIPFLKRGRVVKVKLEDTEYDWGIVANFKEISEKVRGRKGAKMKSVKRPTKVQLDVLLHVSSEDTDGEVIPKPCMDDQAGEMKIISVDSSVITHLSAVCANCPNNLQNTDSRNSMHKVIKQMKKYLPDGFPLFHPVNDMKITEPECVAAVKKIEDLEKRISDHKMNKNPLLETEYAKYESKVRCREELKAIRQQLLEAKSILQLEELKCRKRVLRRLGYCSNSDVIQLKGRLACDISSADELLLTEMIFNGVFTPLSPAQACALLSCFVCDEKSDDMPKLSEELSGPLRQMQDFARRIAKVSVEARLSLDEDAYVGRFKPYLMDIVFSWCNGSSFSDLCKMTEIFEGSIVRCVRRLEELLRQMVQGSKIIGNSDLENKFDAAINLIKRDIIFSSSLYL